MGIRNRIRKQIPRLAHIYWERLAPALISDFSGNSASRTFNDPVWRSITLSPVASTLLKLPLLQRLRYTRQLGVAHLVYTGAHHSRLEHSLGCAHAAGLMFDALHNSAKTKLKDPQGMREIIVCSALMHDCGHTAFSHSGEKLLEKRFQAEWQEARNILGTWLPPTFLPHRSSIRDYALPSGAAEIATLMFLLSPSFEEYISHIGWHLPPDEVIQTMASFVVGRPFKTTLIDGNNASHTYLSRIVSGDMDADKLDYVARDAFYAGLPITVDTSRLLDQLKAVAADINTPGAREQGLQFNASDPATYYLFGLAPAGIAALELFVFTRSHLFDRIYSHHKVNAAEIQLEEMMDLWSDAWKLADESNFAFMEHLYAQEGDDGFLATLRLDPFNGLTETPAGLTPAEDIALEFSDRASALFERRLPYRALAISSKSLPEAQPSKTLFQNLLANIFEKESDREKFRIEIGKKLESANEKGVEILICPAKRNPVKENPDIWVATESTQTLQKVNSRFNVEQLANAYRDIKQVHWIFCKSESRIAVAAAVAWHLKEEYDVTLGPQSFEKAKLSITQVLEKLRKFNSDRVNSVIFAYEQDLKNSLLKLPFGLVAKLFPQFSPNGNTFIPGLYDKLRRLELPYSYYGYIFSAFNILKILLDHAEANWSKADYESEKNFQCDLETFFTGRLPPAFKVHSHEVKGAGNTDIVIDCGDRDAPIVIELKHTSSGLAEAFDQHAGQPAAYACDRSLSPVSFLYTTFNDISGQTRLVDAIDIRTGVTPHTKHVIICVGLMRYTGTPCQKGQYNKKVV